MSSSALRRIVRPLAGLAVATAMVGVPAAAASAAEPTVKTATAGPTENSFCDWESGYGCAGYGYHGYPSDDGRQYGYGDGYAGRHHRHGRHHRY